jgi:C1A family cysteine protease
MEKFLRALVVCALLTTILTTGATAQSMDEVYSQEGVDNETIQTDAFIEYEGVEVAIQNVINEKSARWTAKRTALSDLPIEEKEMLCGLKIDDSFNIPAMDSTEMVMVGDTAPSDPTAFDWRNYDDEDWTTPIRDQGSCGSCWAFGALAAMEAHINIQKGDPTFDQDLSEQDLLSCSPGSCGGWYEDAVLDWLMDEGTIDESCFPYQADETISCDTACPDNASKIWRITNWGWISASRSDIKGHVLDSPIVTGMAVYEDFYYYGGGIYEHVWGGLQGYHLVSIVGYNETAGYWICKNSWGTSWGESGWFKIKYGQCGIEDWNAYIEPPIIEPTGSVPQAPIISSLTHPDENQSYCTRNATFNWTTPQDASEIVCYGYTLDQSTDTTPVDTCDASENTTSYTNLTDGTWYFHVKAKNTAGNWGPAGHYKITISACGPNVVVTAHNVSFSPVFPGKTTQINISLTLNNTGDTPAEIYAVFKTNVSNIFGLNGNDENLIPGNNFKLGPAGNEIALTNTSFPTVISTLAAGEQETYDVVLLVPEDQEAGDYKAVVELSWEAVD